MISVPRIISALLIGLLGLLSGCTAFPMRSQQVWRSAIDYGYPSFAVGTPAFEAALDCYTESTTHAGCSARLLQNGDEAYPVMLELIGSAKTRISLATYIIEHDRTTDRFFQALKEAAGRGVEVRVMVDAAGFHRGLIAQLNELDSPGIQARVFNPFFMSWTIIRGNNRDHRKILVVDGEHAIMGGINISDKQAGDGINGWRDVSLLVSGPAAVDAEWIFAETWEQAGRAWLGRSLPLTFLNPIKRTVDAPWLYLNEHALCHSRFTPPPYAAPGEGSIEPLHPYDTTDATVRVVGSSPDRRNSTIYDLAILGVLGARERIDIACAYFVPPLNLRRALLEAAGRGVKIRLLLPGVTDVKLVREIGMRFYGELLAAGIEIYEWPHPILHCKTMVVDDCWTVVGSANMDSRSYFLNYEANFAVTDPVLARAAHAQFERDLRHAPQLTPEMWRERSASQKAMEMILIPVAGQY